MELMLALLTVAPDAQLVFFSGLPPARQSPPAAAGSASAMARPRPGAELLAAVRAAGQQRLRAS